MLNNIFQFFTHITPSTTISKTIPKMNLLIRVLCFCFFLVKCNAAFIDNVRHILPEGEYTGGTCWIYNHMPKAGGTTVIGMMMNTWGDRVGHWGSGHWKQGEEKMNIYSDSFTDEFEQGTKNIIVGEPIEALERTSKLANKCQKFTIFREPVSRMVSAYYYCQKIQTDELCGTETVNSRDVDLLTFAKHWGNFSMRQFILSFFSPDTILDYTKHLGPEMDPWYKIKEYMVSNGSNDPNIPEFELFQYLQPVQDIIQESYVIGLMDEFNSTMSLFDEALGMPKEVISWRDEYNKQGILNSNKRFDKKKIPAMALSSVDSEIKKYLQIDILLYEHAVSVFNRQLQEYNIE